MSTADFAMFPLLMKTQTPLARSERVVMRERVAVISLVMLLHASVFGVGMLHTEPPSVQIDEMSVSFAQKQSPQVQMESPPVKPEPMQKPLEEAAEPDEEKPAEQPVVAAPTAPAVTESKPAAPVVANTQPDFRADYLNNPRPPYPMVARRMGYHGKVVLNVEVLAEGRAGQVQLYTSSGHDILDNAALQTVKNWRFTPARRLGQPVTEWFLVPINFSLEDNKA